MDFSGKFWSVLRASSLPWLAGTHSTNWIVQMPSFRVGTCYIMLPWAQLNCSIRSVDKKDTFQALPPSVAQGQDGWWSIPNICKIYLPKHALATLYRTGDGPSCLEFRFRQDVVLEFGLIVSRSKIDLGLTEYRVRWGCISGFIVIILEFLKDSRATVAKTLRDQITPCPIYIYADFFKIKSSLLKTWSPKKGPRNRFPQPLKCFYPLPMGATWQDCHIWCMPWHCRVSRLWVCVRRLGSVSRFGSMRWPHFGTTKTYLPSKKMAQIPTGKLVK